jgi:bifunctional non-homologous end joining protein LigD
MRTGTLTNPKDTAPFHIARMGTSVTGEDAGGIPIALARRRAASRAGRRTGKMAGMRPMLATPVGPGGAPPAGPQWSHEVKWDGMRVLADVRDGEVRLLSRNETATTVAFPELVATGSLTDAHLDGEVVAMVDGRPSFAALAERMHVQDARRAAALAERLPVTYLVFDIVRLYGVDLLARPLEERRATLGRLELPERWQVPPDYEDGQALAAATLDQGLEGVVSKRRSSRYQPGRRSPDWLKTLHHSTQTAVIGGWRPQTGTSTHLGSLLLGLPGGDGRLDFIGRAGSGLTATMAADLARLLAPLRREHSPFVGALPHQDVAGAVWVEPAVCVEVRHLGLGGAGRLRQPVLRGLRTDVSIEELRREP